MTSKDFISKAKMAVIDYFNGNMDVTDKNSKISDDDVFVVWYCKTLQHHKALLSTTVSDGMYYELTYNGDEGECYFDAYKKWKNAALRWE